MKLPTDSELFDEALHVGYTPSGYRRLLLFVGVMPSDGYISPMKRLAIMEALTEEQADVFNRQAAGQKPPDMPMDGVEVFNV